ncbi:transmembrane protein 273 isoform X1 [Phascolarctos cinereus]
MAFGSRILKILLFLNFGGVQVLATGKSTGVEIDIKYAVIGTILGIIISVGFLALKICMIRKHMFDNDSSDILRMSPQYVKNCGTSSTDLFSTCFIWSRCSSQHSFLCCPFCLPNSTRNTLPLKSKHDGLIVNDGEKHQL